MDEQDFAFALAAHFAGGGFVVSLPSSNTKGECYLALCARDAGGVGERTAPTLNLTVTDCLSGVFRQRLGFVELTEVRREAGMPEFPWNGFLRLLSAALRGESGCSATVELIPPAAGSSAKSPHVQLALRFQLEAAALVSRIDISDCVLPPLAAPGTETYLRELHSFILGAVTVARSGGGATELLPRVVDGSQLPSFSLASAGTMPVSGSSAGTGAASRKPESAAAAPGGSAHGRGPAPKKRVGGSLVDPHARRARGGAGSNPFQLSSG